MKPQAVKGTHDILPVDQARWRYVYDQAARVLERAGVQELSTPVFEYSEVFTKAVGESSDLVVQHELYTFEDPGGRSLTLRPEFTGGVMRAYIEHGMHTWPSPVKLWSRGPIFRAEKPQRGRYRQFHQVNCELLGLDSPLLDAEAIALLYAVLEACGLTNLTLKLGSLGDPADRLAYNAYLREALKPVAHKLSPISQERLKRNPLRLFDSKDEGDQQLLAELERPFDRLGEAARAHFEAVASYLAAWGIPFEIDGSLVRGLDYYCRTAFEIHHEAIGAQSALCGGGRYDGLVESLGGPPTPGVGWAFGVERVLDALDQEGFAFPNAPRPALYLVPMDDEAVAEVARVARELRREFTILHSYAKRNPSKGLKEADRAGAHFAALRGKRERELGIYQLKDLGSGAQRAVEERELSAFLARNLTPAHARATPA